MKKSFILVSLLLLSVEAYGIGKHWNVFLFSGQSNMVGGGLDSNQITDDAYDEVTQLYMVAGNSGSEAKTDGWVTTSGVNQKVGPERAFGRVLSAEGMPNVAIIKYAINGSSLVDDFQKDVITGQQLYYPMLETFQSALQALSDKGDTYTVHGFYWLQGTADTNTQLRATSYEEKIIQFFEDLRTDLNLPELRFTTARHPAFWSNRGRASIVRAAQIAAFRSDPLVSIIDCQGTNHVGDRVHYDADSKEILGKRFAQNYLLSGRTYFTYFMAVDGGAELEATPEIDYDQDGRSNLEEYFWGTNPFGGMNSDWLSVMPIEASKFRLHHGDFSKDLSVSAEVLNPTHDEWLEIGAAEIPNYLGVDGPYSIWQLPEGLDNASVIVRFNLTLQNQ